MMKKSTFYLIALFLTANVTFQASAQNRICVAEQEFQEQAKQNPALLKQREEIDAFTAQQLASPQNSIQSQATRVIPVVVHVVHDCGTENISKAQILDQIRILNLYFQKQNADTVNIPTPFKALAANANVEFRLAQKDPSGNCTDGITRDRSYLTNSCVPRDRVKSVSYWDSKKYLNIWIVKSIYNTDPTSTSVILGYAQFPGGSTTTDGMVIRADYFGSIGTATNNGDGGRTTVHEAGHWLNLRHIWGDANCGDDLVADTPQQQDQNYGCPTYPRTSPCAGNGSYGDMFMNHMDYSNGVCKNMFSIGQSARMDVILNSTTVLGSRNAMWQSANLIATGTDGTPAVECAPRPGYCATAIKVCAGDSLLFTGSGYNSDNITYSWSFNGGTPSSITGNQVWVKYPTAGTYDFTLTTSNTAGSNNKTYTAAVTVNGAPGLYGPLSEDFENPSSFPGVDGYIENPDNSSNYKWERVTTTSVPGLVPYSGSACIRARCAYNAAAPNEVDSWITPSMDLSTFKNVTMSFYIAYARYATAYQDEFRVFASTNCGKSWTQRFYKGGATLATTTASIQNFYPTSLSQWRKEAPVVSAYSQKSNVRFKFEFIAGADNSLYLDSLTISGEPLNPGVIENSLENMNFNISPNPAKNSAFISFNVYKKGEGQVELLDMLGQQVKLIDKSNFATGVKTYSLDVSSYPRGVYFVRVTTDNVTNTRKLVVE